MVTVWKTSLRRTQAGMVADSRLPMIGQGERLHYREDVRHKGSSG
jgi:hypothetical protein